MATEHGAPKLKVFVSYSRADTRFADELVAGLDFDGGFDITIDRHSIEKGEDWKARLGALIEAADTIVFVLSPTSATSEICRWEVERAAELNKRILPVLHLPLAGVLPPPALGKLNYVDFTVSPTLIAGIRDLATALRMDLGWLREATRLLNLALDWERAGRRDNRLLSGPDITEAKAWVAACPAPEQPTELHRDYIRASEAAEVVRLDVERGRLVELAAAQAVAAQQARRVASRTLVGLVVAVMLAGAAGWFGLDANRKTAQLEVSNAAVVKQKHAVELQASQNKRLTDETQVAQSGLLANTAGQLMDSVLGGDSATAMLLSLEAVPDASSEDVLQRNRKHALEAEVQLDRSLRTLRDSAVLAGYAGTMTSAAWSPDGNRIVTSSYDNTTRVWDARSGKELALVDSPNLRISKAPWSSDSGRIVALSADNTAQVWDALTGKQLIRLVGHGARLNSAAWSSDGSMILTISDDGTARVWDAISGTEQTRFNIQRSEPWSSEWSPDGTRIVTLFDDATAGVWNAATGKVLIQLNGHDARLNSAAWNGDGSMIVTASDDGTARVWDAYTGTERARFNSQGNEAWSATWSTDGTRIVTTLADRTARVWDPTSGKEVARLNGHGDDVSNATWSADGAEIVTTSADKTARLWDPSSGKELARLAGHSDTVWMATHNRASGRIITSSSDGTARIWDAPTGALLIPIKRDCFSQAHHASIDCRVTNASWSGDGTRIATISADKAVRVWDALTGEMLTRIDGHGTQFNGVAWSGKGRRIVTASDDKTARVWDSVSGKELLRLDGHDALVSSVAWSDDTTRIVTTSDDKTARVWDAGTGKELLLLIGHEARVNSAAWNSDASMVVTASDDETVRVWDAATGKERARFYSRSGKVSSATWSPDGTRILIASADKTARVWDAGSGKELVRLIGHTAWVNSATWGTDGTKIVTASSDYTARVWDASTGAEIARLEGHGAGLANAAWGHRLSEKDLTQIVTASTDGTARIWNVYVNKQALIDATKVRAPRCLTQAQQAQYFLPPAPPTWCVERRLWPYQGDEWQAWLPKQKTWLAAGRQGDAPALPKVE